jgi:hypothetical protein
MKLRLIVGATMIFAFSAGAFANSETCSSADQSLSYSYFRSNGGAFIENESLTFKGQTEENINHQGEALDLKISHEQQIDKVGTQVNYTATMIKLMEGSVGSGAQLQKFSEWVLCEEIVTPVCHECP